MRRAGQLRMEVLLVAGVLALAVCAVAGAQSYVVTHLGPGTNATAINDLGWVAGAEGSNACIWVPNGANMDKVIIGPGAAADINDLGQVVGCLTLNDGWGTTQAQLWRSDGTGWSAVTLPFLAGGTRTYADEINDHGLIVGYAYCTPSGEGEQRRAVAWQIQPDGSVSGPTELPCAADHSGMAEGVNNAGWIVGRSWGPDSGSAVCVWEPTGQGGWSDPHYIGGSWANAVNEAGQVVGTVQLPGDERHVFLYDEVQGFRDLGKMGRYPWTTGHDITDGTPVRVVGQAIKWNLNGIEWRADSAAFVWANGSYTDLTSVLGPRVEDSGATAINDRGQIVGGVNRATYTGAFLLTPAGAAPVAPIAEAGGPYSATAVPGTIMFDGSGSHDPDGTIASYLWDFGDGTPTEGGVSPQHTYTAARLYTVTLLVMDNDGYTDIDTATVTIGTPAPLTIGVESVLVTAEMGVNKKWQATATVTVVDASDAPVSGATVSGAWTGAYAGTSSGVTDTTGRVALTSGWAKPGTFTFTVTNVTHPNAAWDGVQVSGTVTVP